jgi:hypothetical protein
MSRAADLSAAKRVLSLSKGSEAANLKPEESASRERVWACGGEGECNQTGHKPR